ncbi:MAG: peptidase [Sphingobacteriales bacterium]|nr:peptidase [Sphingobacteriales bacterium]
MKFWSLSLFVFFSFNAFAQQNSNTFTQADSLRGNLTDYRTCYDIKYYHLDIKTDIVNQSVSGSNLFRFMATANFKTLQFDLFENLKIEKVVYKNQNLAFKRKYNAVFIDFPEFIIKGALEEFTVFYSGKPAIAVNAPWDGGFIYSKDAAGKPWLTVACQGFGASSWWPNKDHQSDEVDSMQISVSVPKGLTDVSNGRLRSVENTDTAYTKYNWFVSYPINNYSVTLNIGDYAHFSDMYTPSSGTDTLSLDYYVLRENLAKAKPYFTAEVKPMLNCFEHWFGKYPFYRDGYKLIETPYLGMEHQSAVAYGNKFRMGYAGRDLSGTGLGLTWDYLIVHESGHEWFGNNITSKDIADMWIHEGFTTYSEGLYVECKNGKDAGTKYLNGLRKNIANDKPIIGPYNVNTEGSKDMYFKGANMLLTIRSVINDDNLWLDILRGLNNEFGLKTTTTEEVVNYINNRSGKDLTSIFNQYLRHSNIPLLEYKYISQHKIAYRWVTNEKNFSMPFVIPNGRNSKILQGGNDWRNTKITNKFTPDQTSFYINVKEIK